MTEPPKHVLAPFRREFALLCAPDGRIAWTDERARTLLGAEELDLSKMEAGKIRLHVSRFEVENLFSAPRGMSRPLRMRDDVALVVESASGCRRSRPGVERAQVHAAGRGVDRRARGRPAADRVRRQRHRHRHPERRPRARVRGAHPARESDRRDRPRVAEYEVRATSASASWRGPRLS